MPSIPFQEANFLFWFPVVTVYDIETRWINAKAQVSHQNLSNLLKICKHGAKSREVPRPCGWVS